MTTRSQDILQWPEWSMHRAYFKSMGYSDYDLERPLIGIANSWNRVVPGHYNLNLVSDYVKQGILQAGGTPVEFGVMAPCDGIAQSHDGMHYILPSRDLIANDVEMMVEAHQLDAVVLLGSCDKIVPGMLMAAARLDVPAIVVVGGPMEGGCTFDERAADSTSITEGLGIGTMRFSTSLIAALGVAVVLVYLWVTEFGSRHRYDAVLTLRMTGDPAAGAAALQGILRRHSLRVLLTNERRLTDAGVDLSYRLLLRDPKRDSELKSELDKAHSFEQVSLFLREDESEI